MLGDDEYDEHYGEREDDGEAEDGGEEEGEGPDTESLIVETDSNDPSDIPQGEIAEIGILGLPDHGLTFDQFMSAQTGMDISDVLQDMGEASPDTEFADFYGPSESDSDVWHMQQHGDTCAIVCQEFILKEFGIDVTEDELRDIAIQNGYYYPGEGTTLFDIGALLEHYNIEVDMTLKSDIPDVIEKLSNGHKVIVALDYNEILHSSDLEQLIDAWGFIEPNHAVVITGYDFTDPNSPKIFLNDPGSFSGKNFSQQVIFLFP